MDGPALDQAIRFCAVAGGRVAYATVGTGPALVLPPLWISHLELEWGMPEVRAFVRGLASGRTVVRMDRLGVGLSDRVAPPAGAAEALARDVEAVERVVEALGLGEFAVMGVSWGGCAAVSLAVRHPDRVRRVALVGAFADGAAIAPPALREGMVATVRAHWGARSRLLTDVWLPGADADARERFARLQRASASAEMAAATLEAIYATDVRELAARVSVPALVAHRRGDRAMPFEQGRALAAALSDARLVTLEGEQHPPWMGDADAVVAAVSRFLHEEEAPEGGPEPARMPDADAENPLSVREREVLALIAEGLADGEIAERLVVSPHTVHRHVANIRAKLRQPSRAAAAAVAARRGLI